MLDSRDIVVLITSVLVGVALILGRMDQEAALKVWLTVIGFYTGLKSGEYVGRRSKAQ